MPLFYEDASFPMRRDPLGQGLPIVEPNDDSVLAAAFRQENIIGSAIDRMMDANRPSVFAEDREHDPLSVIRGTAYESDHLDRFVGSRSEPETRFIMSRIDREMKDRETIAAGGLGGVVAAMGAGVLDPTIFIPGGAVVKTGRGAVSAVRTAMAGAAAVGAGVAAQEAVLQGTQEARPASESIFAIGTGSVLGALLGGAVAGLSKAEQKALENQLDAIRTGMASDPDYVPWQPVSGGAASSIEGTSSGRIKGALGAEAVLSRLGPVTRAQQSSFETTPRAMAQMADAGLTMRENAQGIATAEGGTAESRIRMREGGLGEAISIADTAYAKYFFGTQSPSTFQRMSAAGRSEMGRWTGQRGKLTAREFYEEVGRAMARNDEHAVPEIAEAAKAYRRLVFDPLKDEAIGLKLLPEDVKAVGADSYITRVYNHERIIAQRDRWTKILEDWFRAERDRLERVEETPTGLADMSDPEVRALVDEVTDTILGNNPFRLPGLDIVQGPRGPLKERVLRISDALIEDFLERDVRKVAKLYTRSMAADVELTAKFGDPKLEATLKTLNDEKNAKIAGAKDDKERVRLQKQYESDRRDLEAVRDRLRHVYAIPDNPDGLAYRAAKVVSQLNYLRLLGGMTISAIPDLARPIMVYGLTSTLRDGWRPFVTNIKAARLAAREVKLAGTGLDMALDSRTQAMADLFQDFQRGSVFERALDNASARFGVVSLMAPWNAAMKQITGVMVMSNVLRATKAIVEGKATPKQIERLAASGINDDMARRIWGEFQGTNPAPSTKRKVTSLPSSSSLSTPNAPTREQMDRLSRVEDVSLGQARSTQSKMEMKRFDSGDHPPPLIEGYSDLPVAVRREDGEFLIFDGHHRAVRAINEGRDTLRMHVIDARDYAPEAAGRKPAKETISDDDLLAALEEAGFKPEPAPSVALNAPRGEIRDGVYLPNTEDWTDSGARNALRAAIVRDVDRIIVTPGVERPLWTSQTWGRLMGQFKAFAFASTQRTLMAGLQQRDAAFLSGLTATLALGALSFYVKSALRGESELKKAENADFGKWAVEAIDNSGVLGILADVNNVSEKMTRGRVGLSYFTGEQASRYQSRNALGALLGPSFDLAGDAIQITGSAAAREWTQSDTRAVRKMLPFQNLFWMRELFNRTERGVNATFGVPQKRQQ